MPINIPLAVWIIYATEESTPAQMSTFTGSLLVGLGATVIFTVTLWLAAKAGFSLVPMLTVAYLAWAATLGVEYVMRTYVLRISRFNEPLMQRTIPKAGFRFIINSRNLSYLREQRRRSTMDVYRPQPQASALGTRVDMRAVMKEVYLWMTLGLITSCRRRPVVSPSPG